MDNIEHFEEIDEDEVEAAGFYIQYDEDNRPIYLFPGWRSLGYNPRPRINLDRHSNDRFQDPYTTIFDFYCLNRLFTHEIIEINRGNFLLTIEVIYASVKFYVGTTMISEVSIDEWF